MFVEVICINAFVLCRPCISALLLSTLEGDKKFAKSLIIHGFHVHKSMIWRKKQALSDEAIFAP